MDKKLMFNYVTDVDGIRKRYPKNASFVAFFMCVDSDYSINYYIYASCTKRNFTCPELIHVSADDYNTAKALLSENGKVAVAENLLNNPEEVSILLHTVSDIVKKETQTVGDMLNLTDGGVEF